MKRSAWGFHCQVTLELLQAMCLTYSCRKTHIQTENSIGSFPYYLNYYFSLLTNKRSNHHALSSRTTQTLRTEGAPFCCGCCSNG